MGSGSYKKTDWQTFSTTRGYHKKSTTVDQIFSKKAIHDSLDPHKFKLRESLDSDDNPESTPIILGLDVTGSMSPVLDSLARKGMKTICEEIYNRKPVSDPHICSLGIGDVTNDTYPFQATQFEADVRIFEQLADIYLEGRGGGNGFESYILAWYFAKYRTKTDSFSKRGRKGFIFTFGDEGITPGISSKHFKHFLNDPDMPTVTAQELYDIVYPEWNVFHIIIKEGDYASREFDTVLRSWQKVVNSERVIPLEDHTKIGELIVSTMEIASGKDVDTVVNSWDGDTSVVIRNSLFNMPSTVRDSYQSKSIEAVL